MVSQHNFDMDLKYVLNICLVYNLNLYILKNILVIKAKCIYVQFFQEFETTYYMFFNFYNQKIWIC